MTRQHRRPATGSNVARPGLGSRAEAHDDHAVDPPDGEVVFSFQNRQRLREASGEAHAQVVERLRHATRQGAAATPAGLGAEVRAIHEAIQRVRTSHGAAQHTASADLRVCYLAAAASCIVLAERATRPAELRRGAKSSTAPYRMPDFSVPRA